MSKDRKRFESVAIVGVGRTGRFFAENLVGAVNRLDAVRRNSIPDMPAGVKLWDDLTIVLKEQKPDALLLAVPNPVGPVVKQIAEFAPESMAIILTENGADAVADANKALVNRPDISVVDAKLYTTVGIEENGDLKYNRKKRRMAMAPVRTVDNRFIAAKQEAFEKTQNLFKDAGFKVEISENPDAVDDTKLITNELGFTAVATGFSTEETFTDKNIFKVEVDALKGRLRLMEMAGIPFENYFGTWKLKWLAKVPTPVLSLFRNRLAKVVAKERNYQPPVAAVQIEKGDPPSEVRFYTDPFVNLGEKHGVETPVERTINRIIDRQIAKTLNLKEVSDRKALFLEILNIESQEPFTKAKKLPAFLLEKFARFFIRDIRISGIENLDAAVKFGENGNVIYVPNHNSHADHPALLFAIKDRMGEAFNPDKIFVIAGMLFKNEFLSNIFSNAWDHLTVWTVKNKKDKEEAWRAEIINRKALKVFVKKMKEKASVIVYPEGTRGKDETLQKAVPDSSIYFKSGSMIVPVAIRGTRGVLSPESDGNKFRFKKLISKIPVIGKKLAKLQLPKRGVVYIEFGEPIMADDLNRDALQLPTEQRDEYKTGRVMGAVGQMLPEEHRGSYAQAA